MKYSNLICLRGDSIRQNTILWQEEMDWQCKDGPCKIVILDYISVPLGNEDDKTLAKFDLPMRNNVSQASILRSGATLHCHNVR